MASVLLAIIYICFISLGLPDSLLGSAWPTIYQEMNLPVSYAAYVAMTISAGTIVSSLLSDKLLQKMGAGLLVAVSILLTAIGLVGFSIVNSYWQFFLCAVPYGLGAGGVDACLNNYVAEHYEAKHMSWLHAMWGIGAFVSPNIMTYGLTHQGWHQGYFIVFVIQAIISVAIFCSLPLWKNQPSGETVVQETKHLGVLGVLKLKSALLVFFAFFSYCAIETTCFQWSATYLVEEKLMTEDVASSCLSFLYLGMTFGRMLSGFLSMKLSDICLIRIGVAVMLIGVVVLMLPVSAFVAVCAIFLIGLGAGPVYPSIVHSTPALFGKENSQAMIGVQMAFAYTSFLVMPAIFGNIADVLGLCIYPYFMLVFLVLLFVLYETAIRKLKNKTTNAKN